MFDFLKKSKPKDLHIIPEPQQELKLSVRERALNVFSEIEGLDFRLAVVFFVVLVPVRGSIPCLRSTDAT